MLGRRDPSGKRPPVSTVTILVVIVMLLVPALAWMQYRWLGQLSEAERDRMQRTLRTAASQFATEFDGELSRTLISLQVEGPMLRDQNWAAYAQRYSQWVNTVSEPRLVRDVWLVDTQPGMNLTALNGAPSVPVDQLRLRKWNAVSLGFENAEWPPDLAAQRERLASRFLNFEMQGTLRKDVAGARRETSVSIASADDTTLITPVTLVDISDNHSVAPKISILGFTIVRLDPAVVRDSMLAALTARHFHSDETEADYRVAVVERDDASKVIWESEPGVAATVVSSPDAKQPFMSPHPEQMFVVARNMNGTTAARSLGIPTPPPPPEPGNAKIEVRGDNVIVSMIERATQVAGSRGGGRMLNRFGDPGAFEGRWMLMAKHRAGSLEAAVTAARRRNLMVSSSVLLLLTLAVGLIVVSARRAQDLARQQMEFVAAVSHELRTPVSVIGAAAGNLADGVVGDPQRVRKYGETIQGEARRLAETVERVLQLAGIAAGRAAAAQTPIAPTTLIHESLAACRTEIERGGVQVDVAIDDHLPDVAGDVTALKSALQNLISNAVKYGGSAKWMRVSATLRPGVGTRQQVLFIVEDRGPGIDSDDRKHIFEPFYRGRDAIAQQIQGSGLGLNLVHRIAEAHNGSVSVASEPGKGSTFTLALPAASASARDNRSGLRRDLAEAALGSVGGHDRPVSEAVHLVRETATPR